MESLSSTCASLIGAVLHLPRDVALRKSADLFARLVVAGMASDNCEALQAAAAAAAAEKLQEEEAVVVSVVHA